MDKHYICTGGCKGVSESVGVCETQGCPNLGNDLEECYCTDGQHNNFKKGEAESSTESLGM